MNTNDPVEYIVLFEEAHMNGPSIIGKPSILVVDINQEWLEHLEFNFGDEYLLVATQDLNKANEIAQRHWPDVMLLHEGIAYDSPDAARIGIQKDGGIQLPVILITGYEKPELEDVAHKIGGCIAIFDRMGPIDELKQDISEVVQCSEHPKNTAIVA
jgi:CheY-like chemotaxis protein